MKRATVYLFLLGLAEAIVSCGAARVVDRHDGYPRFLALYLLMGVLWLAASRLALARRGDPGKARASALGLVLLVAVFLRVPFLLTEPTLSDDVYRYVWDGRVQNAGINPYLHAPEARELAPLRDERYPGINNKDIPTLYPPLMQVFFAAVTSVSSSVLAMKTALVLAELGMVVLLFAMLSRLGSDPLSAVVYAWSPLAVVEVAGSGHNDVLAVWLLLGALWALHRSHDVVSMALLAGSGLGKVLGFALAPLFVRAVRPRAFLAMAGVTLALAWPYREAGALAFRGLREYGLRWRGNDSLFHGLVWLTGSENDAKLVAGSILVALVLTLVAIGAQPLRACHVTIGAVLLLTATVHPWYLIWIVPFLCFYPSPAWMYLTLGVALSYHSAYLSEPGRPWEDLLWVKVLEYGPFFALAAWSGVRAVRRDGLRAFLGAPRTGRAPAGEVPSEHGHGAASSTDGRNGA